MEEKERRMKLKRERREYDDVHMKSFAGHALEPYYVRPGDADDVFQRVSDRTAAIQAAAVAAGASSPSPSATGVAEMAAAAAAAADSASFIPLLMIGFAFMAAYIGCGAAVLYRLEAGSRTYLDCVFFCFMLLSTIGYGNSPRPLDMALAGTATVWFCSVYILSGMALTAMCFNIVHHGVSTKLRTLHEPTGARPRRDRESDPGTSSLSSTSSRAVTAATPDSWQARRHGGGGGCNVGGDGCCAAAVTVGAGVQAMANYIGHDGYPQPEIVAIATGKPANGATTVCSPAAMAAVDCFEIKFGSVLQEQPSMSVVDLTNLDTIAEADDSVEM